MSLYKMHSLETIMTDYTRLSRREKGLLLKRNKGLLTRIAAGAGVTVGQVSRVFWGQSNGNQQTIDAINAAVDEILAKDTTRKTS